MNKAERTRKEILEKAFELIYQNGYQATSIDKIIDTTQVTKGAFYYHFKNKEEMGIALINEVIFPRIRAGLIAPISSQDNPIDGIYFTIQMFMQNITKLQLENGCPMNNLIQEMAPLNEHFRNALKRILATWKAKMVMALSDAADKSLIKAHDFEETAQFIISSYEGTRGLGKLYKDFSYYDAYLNQLKKYLYNL